MDFEEIKERYKMLPTWARLTIAVLIGLIPAVYVWFDEGDALQSALTEAGSQEDAARQKFEIARKKKANLPKLEETLAFTEEQLTKAKKKLPDNYRIEDILQKAATIAKQTGASLMLFGPGKETSHQDPYQYVELPIATEVEGKFGQLAAFFDRVVHLDGSVFLRHLELTRLDDDRRSGGGAAGGNDDDDNKDQKSPFLAAKDVRQHLRVKAHFDIVVYRAMTEAEGGAGGGDGADASPPAGKAAKPPGPTPAPAAPGKPGGTPPKDDARRAPVPGGEMIRTF